MRSPVWLIAAREFRTYVVTLSFWAALAVGPLAAGGGLLLIENAHRPAQSVAVEVANHDSKMLRATESALKDVASIDGHPISIGDTGSWLTVTEPAPHEIDLTFEPGFPLSASGRALLARTLERDAAYNGSNVAPLTVHQISPPDASPHRAPASIARFLLMTMLWLTLTGSLGMLLQTVVRERATRALESLLASAAPWQIMLGKLIGVGGVSLLILMAWLGSSAALAFFVPQAGLAPSVIGELVRPVLLARAALIYCLAYAFYGSVTVALGGMARDSASAQNLSRPMFIVLIAAFFVALASAFGGAQSLAWLVYVPAFTPFLLLLMPANAVPVAAQILLVGLLAFSTWGAARFAIGRFILRDSSSGLFANI